MNKKKIAIVLNSKFPTKKAYGITTRFTLETLLADKYDAKIFAGPSDYFDNDYEKILSNVINFYQNIFVKKLIKFGESNSSKLHHISWFVGQILQILNNLKMIKGFKPEVLWLRDPWIALILTRRIKSCKVILEIHGTSSKLAYRFLRKYKKNISFFPINSANQRYIKAIMPDAVIGIAPMGIEKKNLAHVTEIKYFISKLRSSHTEILKIGYVGKLSPQGYSKGVEDLILLGSFFKDNSLPHNITLIGHTDQELETLNKSMGNLISKNVNIKFVPHMNHSAALDAMRNFDILILPLPFDPVYQGMPIKLLEYLASGRITIVAKSNYISELFDDSFVPYSYERGDIYSLYSSIQGAITDENLQYNIVGGINYASKFTWESRTKSILNLALD